MRLSELIGRRYKEQPADAYMASHTFLLRGGYIRQVAGGIFTLLPPAKRVAAKIEAIIRREMDAAGGQEVLFPVVLPADLWRESGRFDSVGSELMRMKDRNGRDLCLGMTHEEAAVHLARSEVSSYSEYPFLIYQIQTKFRDEPRSRAGLIRVREFTMKDAYSFHTSQQDLETWYERIHASYERIYRQAGIAGVLSVRSDTGMMGGKVAHEFMYLSEHGEDTLVLCSHCGYRSNLEAASSRAGGLPCVAESPTLVHTPGVTDIDSLSQFLGVDKGRLIKATVFAQAGTERPLVAFIRGDYQVSETKLRNLVGREIFPFTGGEAETDLCFGFLGPVDLAADADIVYDRSLEGLTGGVCGANREDYHRRGVAVGRDFAPDGFCDIAKVRPGDACPGCGQPVAVENGIEVGNIFQLGDKYTASMGMTYVDREGESRYPVMGCYGIGVGRLLSCIIEEHHDEHGPIWPLSVAPWAVHICILGNCTEEQRGFGEELYRTLGQRHEVILDDRNIGAGVQFADADLLGVPVRVVVSPRNMKKNLVELSLRDKSHSEMITKDEVPAAVDRLLKKLEVRSCKKL